MLSSVPHLLLFWMLLFYVGGISSAHGKDKTERKPERILSRKRRYLIFPPGSSYQLGEPDFHTLNVHVFFIYLLILILVYDSVITIPGWTYYAVTGVTAALAWGLPDKPTYPDQELMEKYDNGSLPLLQYRKDGNITESNHKGEIVVNSTPKYLNNNNHTYYYRKTNFSNYIKNYNSFSQNRRKPASNTSFPFNNGLNIRPPISSNYYNASKHYDAFTNYMMKNYFKPWIESDAYKPKAT